jgi:hypothetical protein
MKFLSASGDLGRACHVRPPVTSRSRSNIPATARLCRLHRRPRFSIPSPEDFHTVNKSYDILRQEGLVRINRKSGAVIRRDAGSGPPDAGWVQDWTGRLATLLAEAAAQGMAPEEIAEHCRAAVTTFAFPDTGEDAGPESRS